MTSSSSGKAGDVPRIWGHFNRAFRFKNEGRLEEAEAAWQEGDSLLHEARTLERIQRIWLHVDGLNTLGAIRRQQARFDEGDKAFQEALEHGAEYYGRGLRGSWSPPHYDPGFFPVGNRDLREILLQETLGHVYFNRANLHLSRGTAASGLMYLALAFDCRLQLPDEGKAIGGARHVLELVNKGGSQLPTELSVTRTFFFLYLGVLGRRLASEGAVLADCLDSRTFRRCCETLGRASRAGLLDHGNWLVLVESIRESGGDDGSPSEEGLRTEVFAEGVGEQVSDLWTGLTPHLVRSVLLSGSVSEPFRSRHTAELVYQHAWTARRRGLAGEVRRILEQGAFVRAELDNEFRTAWDLLLANGMSDSGDHEGARSVYLALLGEAQPGNPLRIAVLANLLDDANLAGEREGGEGWAIQVRAELVG